MERNIGDQLNKAFEAYRQVSIEKDNAKKELQQMSEYYERYTQKLQKQIDDQQQLISKLEAKLSATRPPPGESELSRQRWMFEQQALQEYILLCCQNPTGGLLDKPGKSRDFYHTCYCLSGLSVAQHFGNMDLHHEMILGREENRLAPTHPVYNICPEKVASALEHFLRLPVPSDNRQPGASADDGLSDPASASGSGDHQS